MASVTTADKNLLLCKKCGECHEKPINNKCEKLKAVKEDKRDSSRDSAKKTPRGKPVPETAQGDKVLDLVLNTMSTFTDKLSAMEEKISGLSSHMDSSAEATPARKSRSREKTKRPEPVDTSDDRLSLFSTGSSLHSGDHSATFTQTFPDTVVTFKPTPARAKKLKLDIDLGVTPLETTIPKTLDHKFAGTMSHLPKPSATISRPSVGTTLEWENPVQGPPMPVVEGKPMLSRDENQNFQFTDQYGNAVKVQSAVNHPVVQQEPTTYVSEPLFSQTSRELTGAPSMDLLKANPVIQRLVEERVAVLEARMWSELSQGNTINNRKKSGRYNVTDTPCAPVHLRWPNEACPAGATRKCTPYDDLTLGQFVTGFLTNVLDTQSEDLRKHMLGELLETVKLSENLSWPIARGAFAVAMHRIEDESISWANTRYLAENRLTFLQTAVFNGSTTQ